MSKELIMIVDDVFNITGKGVIVTGKVLNEKIEVGQKVIIDPEFLPEFESEITGIETFRKNLKFANQNDYVGIILKGVEKNKVKKKMKIYTL
jgi:translation elongation factor EF-Tu-like GTPase